MKFKEVIDRTLTLEVTGDETYPVAAVEASSAGPAQITFDNGHQSREAVRTPDGEFTPGVVVVQVRSAAEAWNIASVAQSLAQWMQERESERKGS